MSVADLAQQFDLRVTTDRWTSFVAFADEFIEEVSSTQSDIDRETATKIMIGEMMRGDQKPYARMIASEFVAILGPRVTALEFPVKQLMESAPGSPAYMTAASLAGSLSQPAGDTSVTFHEGAPSKAAELFNPYMNDPFIAQLANAGPAAEGFAFDQATPNLKNLRGFGDLQAGDCLFRQQKAIWPWNPFRDFGHAAIYLGCDDPLRVKDCKAHLVVHVVNAKPACQLASLSEFCNPSGHRESFWGAYQVDLKPAERAQIVRTALSCVGQHVYGWVKYKGPKKYRCDGFVEYCYESARIASNPMAYRGGGLFEEDRWQTLSPAALRNCLTRKVHTKLLCCAP